MLDTPHPFVYEGSALTDRLVTAILGGPTFESSILADDWERDL